jgi:RNA polymerase sigma factor (sigma-70 family)
MPNSEDPRSDEVLVMAARRDPEGFSIFYRRHVDGVLAYALRRTRDAEAAAELTAEAFAAALAGAHRFDPAKGTASAWLYGIARRLLIESIQQGRVEDRARRRLGIARPELDDDALERIEARAAAAEIRPALSDALGELPAEQRAALEARVVQERDYAGIASQAGASEPLIRKRVSRALAHLRARLREAP